MKVDAVHWLVHHMVQVQVVAVDIMVAAVALPVVQVAQAVAVLLI